MNKIGNNQTSDATNQILLLTLALEMISLLIMQPSPNHETSSYRNLCSIQVFGLMAIGAKLGFDFPERQEIYFVLQNLVATTAITLAPTWWAFAIEGKLFDALPWFNVLAFFYGLASYAMLRISTRFFWRIVVLIVFVLAWLVPTTPISLHPVDGWVWPLIAAFAGGYFLYKNVWVKS